MRKKPVPTSGTERYAGQPASTPMPQYPIASAAVPAMPMPTRMPGSGAESKVSSPASPQGPPGEAAKVIAMGDDYPAGRGGMRGVPMASADQRAQSGGVGSGAPAKTYGAPIGARPSAAKMPARP
ncbi:MAG: hypothetical protein GEU99_15900 [Luteitalea sp.]|nr:hypothetical protein [Luteitalea sp.]